MKNYQVKQMWSCEVFFFGFCLFVSSLSSVIISHVVVLETPGDERELERTINKKTEGNDL